MYADSLLLTPSTGACVRCRSLRGGSRQPPMLLEPSVQLSWVQIDAMLSALDALIAYKQLSAAQQDSSRVHVHIQPQCQMLCLATQWRHTGLYSMLGHDIAPCVARTTKRNQHHACQPDLLLTLSSDAFCLLCTPKLPPPQQHGCSYWCPPCWPSCLGHGRLGD
jgi:hypothetical protein